MSYNVKLVFSGDNRIEVYKYQRVIADKPTSNSQGRAKEATKEHKEINRATTLNRARNNIIRLVETNNNVWKSFITLTYAENMQDIQRVKDHWKYTLKKLHKDYKELYWLYVIEVQQRGAYHLHLLTSIFVENTHSFNDDFNRKYWNRGFTKCIPITELNGVSKYLAVYLTKEGCNTHGTRIYSYSRNLAKPIEAKFLTHDSYIDILQQYSEYQIQYSNQYEIVYQDVYSEVYYFDLLRRDSNEV